MMSDLMITSRPHEASHDSRDAVSLSVLGQLLFKCNSITNYKLHFSSVINYFFQLQFSSCNCKLQITVHKVISLQITYQITTRGSTLIINSALQESATTNVI